MIAGTCRGRRLQAPAGTATRPTADRVREAIFDVLGSREPVGGLRVLDLFAGSGAMGIEALSRGAAGAVFVDRSAEALSAVRGNLAALGLEERARVVRADVLMWLATQDAPAELVFCDPPYGFDRWSELLELLDGEPGRLAVLESSQPVELSPRWEVVRQKRYGGTLVTVVERAGVVPTAADDRKGSS